MVTWEILIPTVPHRHAKLCGLLELLDRQMQPGVTVVVYADNLQATYTQKLQALADAAQADYVSVLSDDDSVAPDFIPRIMEALTTLPDQVGFRVRYTEAGIRMMPVIHSLACGGWRDDRDELRRDIMYFNPVRRDLAQRVRFRGPFCDMEWADDLRALGCVKTEVFIDDEIFYYQRDGSDNFHTPRSPMPDPLPRTPVYPWLDVLA